MRRRIGRSGSDLFNKFRRAGNVQLIIDEEEEKRVTIDQ
jgi:hypothetical protein